MPAIPVLMVQYDNGTVDVRYSDGSRLQLSPCGASFCHWDPPDTQLHPLHGVRRIQQRSQFSVSKFRSKVLEALDFRNRFAHQPYLCQELLSPGAVVYLHSNITHIAWANTLQESHINIQPDGTIKLTSEDEYATLVLSKHGRDFTVCYLSKISPFPSKEPKVYSRKNPTSSPKNLCDSDICASVVKNNGGAKLEKNMHEVAECITDMTNRNSSNSERVFNMLDKIDHIDSSCEAGPNIIRTHHKPEGRNLKQDINDNRKVVSDSHHVKSKDSVASPFSLDNDASVLASRTLAPSVIPDKGSLNISQSHTDYSQSDDYSTVGCREECTRSFQMSSASAFLPISARLGQYPCGDDAENVTDFEDLDASEVASNTSYAELKITRNSPPCSTSKHVSFSVPLKQTLSSCSEDISHPSDVMVSSAGVQFEENLAADNRPRDLLCPIPLHSCNNKDQVPDYVKVNAEQFEWHADSSSTDGAQIDIPQNKLIIPFNYDDVNTAGLPIVMQNQDSSLNNISADCGLQTGVPLTHSQTTNRSLELSPIGCISASQKPGYITEAALQSERESRSGHYYTWVMLHVSCSDCPSEWYHPSCLLQQAFDHYNSEEEDFRAEILDNRSRKESKSGILNNLPRRVDTEKCVLCSVADPVPLSCAGQHLHHWHSSGTGDETDMNGAPASRMNVVMSEGVIYRLIRVSSLRLVEVYPGDGSVIFSQGMTGHYFSHLIAHDTELEEKSYSLNHLPADYPGCVYSIKKLVSKAARYFDQMLVEDSHLMRVEEKCCWKYIAKAITSESAPMKVTEECTVPGLGRFTAYSNGRIRVVFTDRTALDMNMGVQSRRRNGLMDDIPTAHCRLLLPNAQYVIVDMHQPAPYQCYVDPTVQWIGWVSATADQRKETYSKHMHNIDQKMSVTRELKKINCFNYIVDETVFSHKQDQCSQGKYNTYEAQRRNTQAHHTGNKVAKHVQFENSRFTHADNKVPLQNISDFDDVRLALQRTSSIIKDIDSILTLKK